jgi:hypothetical protein
MICKRSSPPILDVCYGRWYAKLFSDLKSTCRWDIKNHWDLFDIWRELHDSWTLKKEQKEELWSDSCGMFNKEPFWNNDTGGCCPYVTNFARGLRRSPWWHLRQIINHSLILWQTYSITASFIIDNADAGYCLIGIFFGSWWTQAIREALAKVPLNSLLRHTKIKLNQLQTGQHA